MSAILRKIPTPDPVAARLAALGIESVTYAHPPVFRVGEDDAFIHHMPGGHTKNLFLKDKKGGLWLVTALQDTKIDLKWLSDYLRCPRFSFGSAEILLEVLSVTPGSVTPLALMNDTQKRVRPVLDVALMGHEVVNVHPLVNDKTTALKPGDLAFFLQDLGYAPVLVDFPLK
jgi:Ala-tRNA(Pro) deacylase